MWIGSFERLGWALDWRLWCVSGGVYLAVLGSGVDLATLDGLDGAFDGQLGIGVI